MRRRHVRTSPRPAGNRARRSRRRPPCGRFASACRTAGRTLLDARAAERFRGDVEPIDAVAGHIPGAINAPYQGNLDADGRFLDRAALRARFDALLASAGGKPAICYCGSGVSAAHNVLAMTHAGLEEPALYVGSWSEWITDPANPVATSRGAGKAE